MALSSILLILTASLAVSQGASSFFEKLGLGITTEVEAIKSPVEEVVVSVFDTTCAGLKSLFGASFTEVADAVEPKLESLELQYRDGNTTVIFNLSTAAVDLPAHVGYNPNKTLIVFCHGFTSSANATSYSDISTALIATGQINVLALDASALLKFWYLHASTYTAYIGEKLGDILAAMVDNESATAANIYLIGHSLGAHICGYTGKTFTNLTGETIARITGLDPAGPCFANLRDSYKLKSTDADFVDVIHSDAGVLGLDQSVGDVDFWPNGGSKQPGCLQESCNHGRSWKYYAESVYNTTAFPAVRCKSWNYFKKGRTEEDVLYMGYAASKNGTTGDYYLQTNYESPYGLGEEGIKFNNNIGIVNNIDDRVDDIFNSS